jgi:hypothetical protein
MAIGKTVSFYSEGNLGQVFINLCDDFEIGLGKPFPLVQCLRPYTLLPDNCISTELLDRVAPSQITFSSFPCLN